MKIYVDGNFKGVVSPYGSGTVVVGAGYTTIYCISSGGTTEWSSAGGCGNDEVYRYELRYSTSN